MELFFWLIMIPMSVITVLVGGVMPIMMIFVAFLEAHMEK